MSWLNSIRSRSISVLIVQTGGCRGCALRFSTALAQSDSIKGITITGNPKHADVLMVTGCINEKSKESLQRIFQQMPYPKAVVAAGACSCSGSLFRSEKSGLYKVDDVIPVDAWVRSCTPNMDEMLEAVVRVVENKDEDQE